MSKIAFSGQQIEAVKAINQYINSQSQRPFVLNGLAGTGKTTILTHVAQEYPNSLLCALTGKAASILRRKTGLAASTIHMAFYRLREVTKNKRGRDNLKFIPSNEDGSLKGEIVFLDEGSMINSDLARDILNTGARLIVSQDPGQLPPITGTGYFNWADFTLTDIHRQALESPIIRQAHAVRNGGKYESDGPNFRVMENECSDEDVILSDIILCYTNATRKDANHFARKLRGFLQITPQVGEPLMCLKNAKDYGIFNGAIYTLLEPFLVGDKSICIDVDGRKTKIHNVKFMGVGREQTSEEEYTTSFDFGYAATVHKSQGSEFANVLLIDEYKRQEQRDSWIYTGITRAAERIVIVR